MCVHLLLIVFQDWVCVWRGYLATDSTQPHSPSFPADTRATWEANSTGACSAASRVAILTHMSHRSHWSSAALVDTHCKLNEGMFCNVILKTNVFNITQNMSSGTVETSARVLVHFALHNKITLLYARANLTILTILSPILLQTYTSQNHVHWMM